LLKYHVLVWNVCKITAVNKTEIGNCFYCLSITP